MKLVRGSEVSTYMRCRKKWKWAWIDGLSPKKKDGKLFFGTLFHKFVQTYYGNINDPESEYTAYRSMAQLYDETDTSRMEQTELDDLWELVDGVTENYVKMWGEKDSKWTVLGTEITFAIPLSSELAYCGTIDLLYLEDGRLWISDHKTSTRMEDYRDASVMDRQISRYYWAVQQLAAGKGYILVEKHTFKTDGTADVESEWMPIGESELGHFIAGREVYGFNYNIILKDLPEVPKPLKKGGLSVDKRIKTTSDLYIQALRDHGLMLQVDEYELVPEEYDEIIQHLRNQEDEYGNKFFRRYPVHRQQAEIDAAIQEFFHTANESIGIREMVQDGLEHLVYRNITHDCSWDCPFKGMCIGTMTGDRVDDLIELFFDKERDEYPTLEVSE